MTARLEVISGPEEGKVFELQEGRALVVGRGKPCHLRLRDPRVSRTHFLLEKGPLAYHLFDMGSSGGTFVNDERVHKLDLAPGDVITIGQSKLRLVVAESAEDAGSAPLPPPDELRRKSDESVLETVGKSLAGFEIQAPIAAGRLGFVFRAYNPRKKLTVAMKILRPEFSGNRDEMRRFIREMKSARDLKHPNIVRVYTADRTGGYRFVVMEHVEGESLAEVIDRIGTDDPLDWSAAFRVAVHMARALDAARRHDLVHQNVKPSNVLLRKEDGLAKLSDLMLAKAIKGGLAERAVRDDPSVDEMAYMSPERAAADGKVDVRSDVYSLGATLYALLTGRPPLEDESVEGLAAKIRDHQPDPPKKCQPAVPEAFDALVMRMLSKQPEDRPQTPAELLDELERIGHEHGQTV